MKGLFVTGTDTGVGKTYVSALLLRQLAAAAPPDKRFCGFKPFCSGPRTDAEALAAASRPPAPLELVNPCWFSQATAPLAALRQQSSAEAYPLQVEALWSAWEQLSTDYDFTVVEGVGGWLAPLLPEMRVADLAKALELPVLVIAANRLGALNHTLLTVERILADGLPCLGVILNNVTSARVSAGGDDEAPARVQCGDASGTVACGRSTAGRA